MRFDNNVKKIMILTLGLTILLICFQLIRMGVMFNGNAYMNNGVKSLQVKSNFDVKAYEDDHITSIDILFLGNNDDHFTDNMNQLITYTKGSLNIVDSMVDIQPYDYDLIVLSEALFLENEFNRKVIYDYVNHGGRVIVGFGLNKNLSEGNREFLGVNAIYEGYFADGFEAKRDFAGNQQGVKRLFETGFCETVRVELSKSCQVIVVDEKSNPIIWRKSYGDGRIGVANGYVTDEFLFRSFVLGLMEEVMPYVVWPVINSMVVFIDDFPANYSGSADVIKKDYGYGIERFLFEDWWPSILSTTYDYGIKYTCAYIATYNNQIEGDFADTNMLNSEALLVYGREIINSGSEIAFHGYNHQSLLYDQNVSDELDYKAWQSESDMINALIVAQGHFHEQFPSYKFTTYVPPSNRFDPSSSKALQEVFSEMQIYSGIMTDYERQIMTQEFGVDENGIIMLPRATSGTHVPRDTMAILDSVAYVNGVISHFLHPDDVLDKKRGFGKRWKGLFKSYKRFLDSVTERYYWMDSLTASEAGKRVRTYDTLMIDVQEIDDGISISNYNADDTVYLMLSLDGEIVSVKGAEWQKVTQNRYLLTCNEPVCFVEVR